MSRADFIKTGNGDYLSKEAKLFGISNIAVKGKSIIKPKVIIRGDLRRAAGNSLSISFGQYCFVDENSIIRPPSKLYKSIFSYYPVKIESYVSIGKDCLIEALQIGSFVEIEDGVIIGSFVSIKDCCKILKNSIVSPLMVIPPYSVVGMKDGDEFASIIGELPECWQQIMQQKAITNYEDFIL